MDEDGVKGYGLKIKHNIESSLLHLNTCFVLLKPKILTRGYSCSNHADDVFACVHAEKGIT